MDEDTPQQRRTVSGRVRSTRRAGTGGLWVEIVDRGVGRDVRLGHATTDGRGRYEAVLDVTSPGAPDLQARVWTRDDDDATFLGESDVVYGATGRVVLDVELLPEAAGLPSEYEVLTAALGAAFGGRPAELEESDERQDVGYLADKTGWDARAVAMAALADRLGGSGDGGIAPAFYYALLRAGLPADPDVLYLARPAAVENVWRDAIARGVIPEDLAADVPRARGAFETLAAGTGLGSRAVPGTSSLDELLDHALPGDTDGKDRFARIHAGRSADPDAFWRDVQAAFDAPTARRLRLDGQLAALTLNNAPLMGALRAAEETAPDGPLTGPADLARRGYFRPGRWLALMDDTVPDGVPGPTAQDRRRNYAELMAAQVRLTAPTAVVAARIGDEELLSDVAPATRAGVRAFLDDHVGRFEIGVEPVERFIQRNADVDAPADPAVTEQIKRIQRVHQVTPHDGAMGVLLDNGLDSAFLIARQDESGFVASRAGDLGPADAAAVHARSRQIANAVVNIAGSFLTSRLAPALGVRADAPILGGQVDAAPPGVLAYPTLEGLFGSMNADACEECGSVVSPSAYLVDLLMFLDRPDVRPNPQQVLLDRRPDIQHLPLTCENTDTVVPYIDLVNETLEYFVAHGSLSGFTGHDTGAGADAAELLADPRFVDDTAYETLAARFHPAPLPFHRPLESLRRLFAALGVPLQQAMAVLRPDDAVDTAANRYGWRDVCMEELGLSRPQHRLLTDRSVTLQQVCGYPATTSDADVVADMSRVATFATRLAVGYEDVVALLGTGFVNPDPRAAILLTGADGPTPTPFEQLQLRRVRADGTRTPLTAPDLARLVRFVRLWRALGWTVAQTDAALDALFPGVAGQADLAALDSGMRTAVARLGLVASVLRRLGPDVADPVSLLACWAPIGTRGTDSLYRRLFLTGPQRDPAFTPDATGAVLTDGAARLLAHEDTVRAAFALTAEEFRLVVDDLRFDGRTPLDLANLAAVYRRAWLARTLGLGVGELLALVRRTGIDPFAAPDPPRPGMTRLLDLVDALRTAGMSPATALGLFWNDPGAADPDPGDGQVLDLARALRSALTAVAGELAFDETSPAERVRVLLAAAVGADAAETFTSMLGGALSVAVPYTHPGGALAPPAVTAGGSRIGYDAAAERLSYAGPLDAATRDRLKGADPGAAGFADAVDALFAAGEARSARDEVFAGAGPALDALVAAHPAVLAAYAGSPDPPARKRSALLDELLRPVEAQRARQAALAAAAAAAGTDAATAAAILDDPDVLHTPGTAGSALAGLVALGAGGLDHGVPAAADTWSGYLEVPETGPYRIGIEADPASRVRLTLDGTPLDLERDGTALRSAPRVLDAGRLVPVVVTVDDPVATAAPPLRRQLADGPWQPVPAGALLGTAAVEALRAVHTRFVKAVGIAAALGLTGAEIAHLAADPALRVDGRGWLDAIPVPAAGPAPAPALTDALVACLRFTRLKATLETAPQTAPQTAPAAGGERLLAVLRGPAPAPGGTDPLLALTGWDAGSLGAVLARLGTTRAALGDLAVLTRVAEVFALLSAFGTSASSLLGATTNDPDPDAVRTLESALRARRGQAAWLDVIRSVNDPVRALRRDALVAFTLAQLRADPATAHVDTADKLFEYFLMDVQSEPCVQTSRVRHAISSVQLFVDRVLMNLEEPQVAPSALNRAHWEWMKRYRLWQANREVFLWPENWLEPELRDDQSPFYRQVTSELLQSDITDDTAATALLGYLSSLEEVAKLEPCAIHLVERDPGTADDVAHVVGRTSGAQRRYYYRRRQFDAWTPWEPIPLDIEDNPVVPVFWKGRLLLFWLKVLNGGQPLQPPSTPEGTTLADTTWGQVHTDGTKNIKLVPQAVLCWSEYYDGRWRPPKTSDVAAPTSFGRPFDSTGEGAFARGLLVLQETTEADALRVRIRGQGNGSSFVLFNTHSLPQREEDRRTPPPALEDFAQAIRDIVMAEDVLRIDYRSSQATASRRVVTTGQGPFRITAPFHIAYFEGELQQSLIRHPWEAPFFVADSRHAFYVSTVAPGATLTDGVFGVPASRPVPTDIPPLIVRRPPPDDDAPNIRNLIDTTAAVRFGTGEITRAGSRGPAAAEVAARRTRAAGHG